MSSLLTPLHRVRAAYHAARAHLAYRRGDVSKAIAHLKRVPKEPPASLLIRAFRASVLILDHRSVEARSAFQEVIDELRAVPMQEQSEEKRYVLNYCMFYVALIDKTEADEFRTAASAASADNFTRRWLPLPAEGTY